MCNNVLNQFSLGTYKKPFVALIDGITMGGVSSCMLACQLTVKDSNVQTTTNSDSYFVSEAVYTCFTRV